MNFKAGVLNEMASVSLSIDFWSWRHGTESYIGAA